jgi:hypothetical protein
MKRILIIFVLFSCTDKNTIQNCTKKNISGNIYQKDIKSLVNCNFNKNESLFILFSNRYRSHIALFVSKFDRSKSFIFNISKRNVRYLDSDELASLERFNFKRFENALKDTVTEFRYISHAGFVGLIEIIKGKPVLELIQPSYRLKNINIPEFDFINLINKK